MLINVVILTKSLKIRLQNCTLATRIYQLIQVLLAISPPTPKKITTETRSNHFFGCSFRERRKNCYSINTFNIEIFFLVIFSFYKKNAMTTIFSMMACSFQSFFIFEYFNVVLIGYFTRTKSIFEWILMIIRHAA